MIFVLPVTFVKKSPLHYISTIMPVKDRRRNTITFLGTAGARFAVISQVLASGGLWLNLDGTEILVDPGPGCLVQAVRRKLKPENLSAIIISHRHLDHAADANIMVEAMTKGGFEPRGTVFAPADALDAEPVVFSYLRAYLKGLTVLEAGKSYSVNNVSFTTPVRHIHPAETYGLVIKSGGHTISYIADGRYFDGLCHNYGGELIIINVVFAEPRPTVDHLSLPDAERIIRKLKPKTAILTHFGMTMWRNSPDQAAEQLTRDTGVNVIAARDGMRFELARLDGE